MNTDTNLKGGLDGRHFLFDLRASSGSYNSDHEIHAAVFSTDHHLPKQFASRTVVSCADSSDGLEQLGFLRHYSARGAGKGQR
jgi:hypothetical protein